VTYTASMKRVASVVLFLLSTSTVAVAQVQVVLSAQHFGVEEQIHATIVNEGTRPITFCVEFGQWSPKNGGLESAPSPFVVQRYLGGKWSTVLSGPDVGSSRHTVELAAGKSMEFPFRLSSVGKIQILLHYWRGSKLEVSCTASEKGAKTVASETFTVQ